MISNGIQKLLLKPIPLLFSAFLLLITILPKISTVLLIVLTVFWLIEGGWKEKFRFYKNHKVLLLMPLFFLVHLFSLLYSSNIDVGFKKMETSLSLLILPLLLPTFNRLQIKDHSKQYYWAYILGVALNALYCIIQAIFLFSYEMYARKNGIELDSYPYTNYFFYSYLSSFMHYGYMAMYVNVAIAILLSFLTKGKLSNTEKRWSYFLIVFLSIFVLMLYSKAGILALAALLIYFILYQLFQTKNLRSALISFGLLVVLAFVLFRYVPYTQERIHGMINGITNTELDPKSHDSTQLRVFVWKASKELIQENWWIGFGFGDANDQLIAKYQENGYVAALEEDLNAHNQFFQTALNVGFIGVLILLIFFVQLFVIGFRTSSLALQIFAVITFLVFLFESYLQTQKGVYYFIVLSSFLLSEALLSMKSKEA